MIGVTDTSITITLPYNQLQQLTITDSLHSLLACERLLFCVTDLVLIYESVTYEPLRTNDERRMN
jgi:hypothetical protein